MKLQQPSCIDAWQVLTPTAIALADEDMWHRGTSSLVVHVSSSVQFTDQGAFFVSAATRPSRKRQDDRTNIAMAQAVSLDLVAKQFPAASPGASRHDPVLVLDNLSLSASPGEIVAVLGPSGCGKSTVLRLIGGLETPSGGRVVIGERPVTTTDDRCSVVFQEPRLLPWRDVSGNVALGANRRRGNTDERARDVVHRLLDRVSLSDFARAYPHQLSGGMAQRVALARGLAAEPEVLLLDEPFAALDALTRMRMQELLMEVWSDRKPTVVLVTHDVDEALFLADRIVIFGGTRPSSIVAEITVPVARPRDHNDPAFFDLRTHILGHFGLSHRTDQARHAPSRAAPSIAAD